ncbi:ABC transporter permease [Rhodoferax sp.]|uniref:ABC transporter permease n=1 Tax=Rhodoferax sp. TaxID=50421 RepID=UPI00374C9589
MRAAWQQVAQAWLETVRALRQDFGVLLLLVAAPLVYAFFYPWPYSLQAVHRVPVMVVDLDHTSLSRQITRWAGASPRMALRGVTGSEQDAQQALWRGEIEGYAILPQDMKRHLLRGTSAVVNVAGDGAYALLNKAVLYGFSEAVGTASAGVEIKKLQVSGQSALQAGATRSPVNVQLVALYNPTEGYGSFVVPAVALLILQQTLLIGVAMFIGTMVETGRHRANAAGWIGRILGLASFGYLSGLFYFGWVFLIQDYPRAANLSGALVLLLVYIPAVCTLGALLGVWFGNRERGMQVLLFTSLPMAFLAGFSWPAEALPWPLQGLRWLIPSTAGIQASLHLNQMGASLADVRADLACLGGLTAAASAMLIAFTRPKSLGP